jgi:APA family basic amino acid/polyamine antiporter
MARDLGDPWLILWLWIIGALLALAGAVCYSELGTAFPMVGGEYIYLRHAYSPFLGFLSGWASFTIGFGAAIAAGAVSFSSYLMQLLSPNFEPLLVSKALALGLVWTFTGVHVAGVGPGGLVQQTLTVLKVGLILGLITAAFTFGNGNWTNMTLPKPVSTPGFGVMFVSLIFVIYAYSGWNTAGYIAGEIANPARNIPRTMIGGTILVGFLYLALNMVYFYALPVTTIATPPLLPVAEKATVALFGPIAGYFITVMLCISIAGSVSAMIWAGPRVYYAMAKDGLFPAFFSKTREDGGTPHRSIILQSVWATILILSGTFEQLVIYSGVILAFFTALAVGAVIVLRYRNPQLVRPYKVPLYPFVPALYIMVSIMIVIYTGMERPTESAWAMATVLTGIPLYFLIRPAIKDNRSA